MGVCWAKGKRKKILRAMHLSNSSERSFATNFHWTSSLNFQANGNKTRAATAFHLQSVSSESSGSKTPLGIVQAAVTSISAVVHREPDQRRLTSGMCLAWGGHPCLPVLAASCRQSSTPGTDARRTGSQGCLPYKCAENATQIRRRWLRHRGLVLVAT